ncbi:MAG: hypothetical protein KTR31_01785 [Myxococcales bacterium]|nr:hypothetical protein [Myxococcales bacterium]
MASSLLTAPAPAHPRVLPLVEGPQDCDVAAGVARLLDTWSPPSVEDVDTFVLGAEDRQAVDQLRALSRCDRTHPLPPEHVFPVFTGLRVLEAHALAEHRAGRRHESLQVLIDGWALAQNVGHDYVVNAMVGMGSQLSLLSRVEGVAASAEPPECLGPALRATQVSARFVSPHLRAEREGGIPIDHNQLRHHWRDWLVVRWSATEAKRATSELEAMLALPASERPARAEALAEGASWWTHVTLRDLSARGLYSMASDAAASQTDLENLRDQAVRALRDCAGGT